MKTDLFQSCGKGFDLIEHLKSYGQRFMTLYRRQGSRPSPRKGWAQCSPSLLLPPAPCLRAPPALQMTSEGPHKEKTISQVLGVYRQLRSEPCWGSLQSRRQRGGRAWGGGQRGRRGWAGGPPRPAHSRPAASLPAEELHAGLPGGRERRYQVHTGEASP